MILIDEFVAGYYVLILVSLSNFLGVLVSDLIIDGRLKESNPDGELSWTEVMLIALSSTIVTMAVISQYETVIWISMSLAWMMGLVFRPLLPEITAVAKEKMRSIIEAIFGEYK